MCANSTATRSFSTAAIFWSGIRVIADPMRIVQKTHLNTASSNRAGNGLFPDTGDIFFKVQYSDRIAAMKPAPRESEQQLDAITGAKGWLLISLRENSS